MLRKGKQPGSRWRVIRAKKSHCEDRHRFLVGQKRSSSHLLQGFQSGPVPGTFTRLRSCIVPAEITEPPKISGGQNHLYGRLVEYFS